MNRISETKQFELRRMWGWRTRTGWLAGLFGLGVLLLLVSNFSSIWDLSAYDPAQAELVQGRARPASMLTFEQVFDLGLIHDDEGRPPVTDAYGVPLHRSWQTRQFITNPTLSLFGRAVKISGRLWLIEGQRRYIAMRLEISLAGSI